MSTLAQYRARAAQELGGEFLASTATGGTAASLIDATWPATSTTDQSQLYVDNYLLRPAAIGFLGADRVRLVKTYTPSTGTYTPDAPWSTAPTNTEPYEIHPIIEPGTALPTLLNQALRHCLLVVDWTFTPIARQTRHNLTTFAPWLTKATWVRQVGSLSTAENRDQADPFSRPVRGETIQDGASIYLNHPHQSWTTNDVVYVRALKPAFFHCAPFAGVYGSQSGLSLENDICPVPEEWLAAATLVEAWRSFGHLLEPQANQRLVRDRSEAAAWFTELRTINLQIPELTLRPLGWFGVARMAMGPGY